MLRVLTIIFLLGLSFESFAGDLQVRNGKLAYPLTEKFNENGFRPWKIIGGGIDQEYQSRFDKSLHVREASTGLRSASTVPVTLEARVSRKAVLSGAFGLVKKGAALGTRLSGWGTAAYFAYQAYETVKPSLEAEGYKWDESKEEFFKYWAARNCITIEENGKNIDVSCFGVDSSVIRAMEKGGQSELDAKKLMESQMQSVANGFWKKRAKELDLYDGEDVYFWQKFQVQKCYFDLNGGDCSVSFKGDVRNPISFRLKKNDKELLDLEKFLKIATPSIDANPTPFVEGTGKPEYKENIKVPAGTVVTIGPFTPENGKPVQVTITFGQDSNGNTTANVATTQRPDLDPGSPEAPKSKPDGNPDGKPDGNPDGKPDKKLMINPIQMISLINVQMINLIRMMIHLIKIKIKEKKIKKMTRKKNQKGYFVIFFRIF
ncbi:cell-surface protein [Neisseria flavescens]|uniref:IgG-binding virulence factor TspB family protein n=1 Tax=Neisseria flavescens TaxID=484 RepID=UPI0007A8A84D|nr:IgG-binding virulence factor TspB family protein [Neisseria flavescens]KZC83584.1 cell-surface protein [Neisseria flavescens]